MIMGKLLRLTILISMSLSACGAVVPGPSSPRPLPSPSGKWQVKLTQSGGFAGVLLSVEVGSDGKLTAQDQRTGRVVTQILSPEATAELGRLIAGTQSTTTNKLGSACADCFIYDLQLHLDTGDIEVHADDTTLGDSGAADLIMRLSQLRDAALNVQ